jgi:hypothetical protein
MRRLWCFVVPLGALLPFAASSTLFRRPPSSDAVASSPTSRVVARRGAVPHTLVSDGADDKDLQWHARLIKSPVFSRLPSSDQRWVLVQARARVPDPDDPRLDQVISELSEVRLFAASEREEPLAPLDPSR